MIAYRVEAFGAALVRSELALPDPQGSEVLVEVSACGLCHSDIHLWEGYFDLGDGERIDATRSVSPPRTLGHEIAGTVRAVGTDVRSVRAGDRRAVFPWIGCGACALCREGSEHLCTRAAALGVHRDGGFAQFVLVPHERYLLDFAPLSEAQACTYGCAGVTAFSALRKAAPLQPGDALLILGAGGVGLSAIRLAKALYGVTPIVAEPNRDKWQGAREAGAGEVVDPAESGALKALTKATGGGVAAAVDFAGSGASFSFAFGALAKAGRLVSVGLLGGSVRLSPALVAMKAVSIAGSYVGSLDEMHEVLQIARAGGLSDLPVRLRPLGEINEALSDLRGGRAQGRIVLCPEQP